MYLLVHTGRNLKHTLCSVSHLHHNSMGHFTYVVLPSNLKTPRSCMKGWQSPWKLCSPSSSSSNRSGHHSACSLSASRIHVSLIHIETKTIGVVDSTVPPSTHGHLLSFFHYYQNVSFVWDGSMPSFLKKQTHYSLISCATAGWGWGGGGVGEERE